MTEVAVQPAFSGGEWSPNLYTRVDVAKYKSAAALMNNFFVDYRGGASTRPGTQYVIQAYQSATPVRVINFQASFNVGYAVEIGNGYMRFHYQGAPVVENGIAISAVTNANPCVITTATAHGYNTGDWIFVSGVGGTTQINARYFIVTVISTTQISLSYILNGTPLDTTLFGVYTSGGTTARIYTIGSPYTSSDNLWQIKVAQSTNQMIMCHPNHPAYALTLISANNWTLTPITFGSTISTPAAPTITTTLATGTVYYSYGVTAIDGSGQESTMSPPGALTLKTDIRTTAGTNTVSWAGVSGAVAYNIYEAAVVYGATQPLGAQYGFVGTVQAATTNTFTDSNIAQNFSYGPPNNINPFVGYSVNSVTVTTPGTFTSVPTISFTGTASIPATATATLSALPSALTTISAAGNYYNVGDLITLPGGIILRVTSIGPTNLRPPTKYVTGYVVTNYGSWTTGTAPVGVQAQVSTTGGGSGFALNISTPGWCLGAITVNNHGSNYSTAPLVVITGGGQAGSPAATANLSTVTAYPTVPGFAQQRLCLASTTNNPATFYLSQPGQYFNFNTTTPAQSNNAVTGTLVSGTLNTIKSFVGSAAGLLIFTDKAVWLVNGGSSGSAISATGTVANPQSYIGASDIPPIIVNYDVLFFQSKGSAVRSLSYNVYYNIFTGSDISVTASHLFFNYSFVDWCWAHQPFYFAHAVRSDGAIVVLTYMKDQEYIGWSHYTTNGTFNSVCSVTEVIANGTAMDSVYAVVGRTINGTAVQYIERFASRTFPTTYTPAYSYVGAWCVDAGIQYTGPAVTTFYGGEQLAGMTVTGLANGVIIPPFVMPTTGIFSLATPATTVTIGLAYTCQLQTLPLEIGEPTIQGKVKKIQAVDFRVANTLGLSMGSSFSTQVPIKDLVLGNVPTTLTGQPSQVVTDLVNGDGLVILDPTYTIPGQYCFQQSQPYPATILGCFPRFSRENPNER